MLMFIPTMNKYNNNTGASYGATFTTNDVIGVALDLDAGTLTFYKTGQAKEPHIPACQVRLRRVLDVSQAAFSSEFRTTCI